MAETNESKAERKARKRQRKKAKRRERQEASLRGVSDLTKQARQQGGRSLGSSTSGGTGADLDRQVSRPGAWSNVDTEAARGNGPGSALVRDAIAGAIASGQARMQTYRNHTLEGAIEEAALRHNVTLYGHSGGSQAGAEQHVSGVLVDAGDGDPRTWQAFSAAVMRMAAHFEQQVGRPPVWGSPASKDDTAFLAAYNALRERYYPSRLDSDQPGGQLNPTAV